MLKTKFEYNHLQNTLYIHQPGSPRQAITKTFTTNWGAPGFILEPANHWITFTVWPNKIRAFYKHIQELENWPTDLDWENKSVSAETLAPISQIITYYQKDLDLEFNSKIKDFSQKNALYSSSKQNPLIFTFTVQDEVHKINNQWVKNPPNVKKI